MLCYAMGGYGDSLCAFHADRSKRITNKEGRNRQEREHREEDHHPPRAELRISPENLACGKNFKIGSKSCLLLAPSGIQADMFAVWKWNFRSWLSAFWFWCRICVDRPLWKLFVCTHVELVILFPPVCFGSLL